MSRLEYTSKNFLWSTVSSIFSAVLGFISRTVFIAVLGTDYLGVNGLFTNILSMLSLAELGIGVAINFSLYKPLAISNYEQIKSLMYFYKRAYQVIALVITCLGLAVLPFLGIIVKGSEGIEHIELIYLIFLFNSTYSYLFSYKRTLLFADQKTYLFTNINTVINILTLIVQLSILLIFRNYFLYLFSSVLIGIVQNLYVNWYVDNKYPFLLDKNYSSLSREERQPIVRNIKAMMFHKIGDLSINQTDNIIISSFINVTTVGLVSNYTLIINTVNSFIMNIFNSTNASLGNLIATEIEKKRLEVFNAYNFLAFWLFGWATVCFYTLSNPFITIWIGSDKIIEQYVVSLILINYYLVGMRVPLGNIKTAAGVYEQDKYIPLIQSAVNLAVSIVGVQYLGLTGVYIGTILSSIAVPCWYRPIIVYRYVFNVSAKDYFIKYIQYLFVVLLNLAIVVYLSNAIFHGTISLFSIMIMTLLCLIIPNVIVILIFHKTREFRYVIGLVQSILRKVLKK